VGAAGEVSVTWAIDVLEWLLASTISVPPFATVLVTVAEERIPGSEADRHARVAEEFQAIAVQVAEKLRDSQQCDQPMGADCK
jgi:hypothetical protein